MWKAFFYGLSWSFTAYVLIVQENGRYFQRPTTVWTDYAIDAKVSTTVYIVYLAQASFYIHSLYATIFQDSWRKDSVVLLVHHVVATILLTVSWSARYHFFGLTCIFLHDCCDVLLEVTKSFNYLKNQQKGVVKSFEVVADIGFLCFTATWFVMRLYLFPLRVLYYSSVYVEQEGIYTPFGFFLNMLMYLLLAMNVYWFTLILHVLYKVVIGQTLEDVRDFKEDEEEAEVLQVLKPSDVGDDKRKKINDKNWDWAEEKCQRLLCHVRVEKLFCTNNRLDFDCYILMIVMRQDNKRSSNLWMFYSTWICAGLRHNLRT